MTAAVSAATESEVGRVVTDLHAAFMDDPVLCWAFPDEGRRRRYGRHYFEMQARRLVRGGLRYRAALHESVFALPAEARALPVFLHGDPAEELIKASRTGVDLLVLGSRGGGPLRRMLHRSVTSAVMSRIACPLLISPAGVTAPQTIDA